MQDMRINHCAFIRYEPAKLQVLQVRNFTGLMQVDDQVASSLLALPYCIKSCENPTRWNFIFVDLLTTCIKPLENSH